MSCDSVLQRVAVCCSVLQCVARVMEGCVVSVVAHYVAPWGAEYIATHCNTLQITATRAP